VEEKKGDVELKMELRIEIDDGVRKDYFQE